MKKLFNRHQWSDFFIICHLLETFGIGWGLTGCKLGFGIGWGLTGCKLGFGVGWGLTGCKLGFDVGWGLAGFKFRFGIGWGWDKLTFEEVFKLFVVVCFGIGWLWEVTTLLIVWIVCELLFFW